MRAQANQKLTPDERRRMILEYLRGAKPGELAQRYEVDRRWLWQLAKTTREQDPHARATDAEAEAAFWREVGEILEES